MKAREPGMTAHRRMIATVFIIHGFVFASWTAHIPHLKAALGLSDHQLGLALLGAPVGSVTSAATLVVMLPRIGIRRLLPTALAGYALGGLLVALATNSFELFGALAVWGYFQGSLDATMNTEAVAIEASGRPMMSRLHGLWSAGSLAGAALGTACVAAGIGLGTQLTVIAVAALGALPALRSRLPAAKDPAGVPPPNSELGAAADPPPDSHRRFGSITWAVVILGLICTADLLCEGAVADWSAMYLRDDPQTSAAVGGLGYAVFMAGMLAIRTVGDRIREHIGSKASVTALAALATVGMGAALAHADPATALTGFLFLGIGRSYRSRRRAD